MTTLDQVKARLLPLKPYLAPIEGLYEMFQKCFTNTLETTIRTVPGENAFIITGDIEAMWLRDSTAQVLHYIRFSDIPQIKQLIISLIARQVDCILLDPYANAFNLTPCKGDWCNDLPQHSDFVWERKYEIDSLAYPLLLAWRFYQQTNTRQFLTPKFHEALKVIVHTWQEEQRHNQSSYWFIRNNCPSSDTLTNGGKGAPVSYTGMTWSGFRPSDDACEYGFLIPSNLFAASELQHLSAFAEMLQDTALSQSARQLSDQITKGIFKYGLYNHPLHGEIFAYEVDGNGNQNFMDDANVPSLLSLPYLGICDVCDERYKRTRKFALSNSNPYYYQGTKACGIGSPHTPNGYIWPISLCIQAMTSCDSQQIANIMVTLLTTHAGTGFMHESFDPDHPEKYTRSWFAWANSLFGQLVLKLFEQNELQSTIKNAYNMMTSGQKTNKPICSSLDSLQT